MSNVDRIPVAVVGFCNVVDNSATPLVEGPLFCNKSGEYFFKDGTTVERSVFEDAVADERATQFEKRIPTDNLLGSVYIFEDFDDVVNGASTPRLHFEYLSESEGRSMLGDIAGAYILRAFELIDSHMYSDAQPFLHKALRAVPCNTEVRARLWKKIFAS